MASIYDFTVTKADGTETDLSSYKGHVLLIVNTASKCGFTPQFAQLQELYETYKYEGFTVLGFPCDQFANQEFEDIEETIEFCRTNYKVTFPMFEKIDVNGKNPHPLFTFLKTARGGFMTSAIKWNFTKFLVDRNGQVVNRFAPQTKPSQIEGEIKKYLT